MMTKGFKKWIYKLIGIDAKECIEEFCSHEEIPCCECENYKYKKITLEILIKAMWILNRKGKWQILMKRGGLILTSRNDTKIFKNNNHSNSEQEALQAALEYIYEQEINE